MNTNISHSRITAVASVAIIIRKDPTLRGWDVESLPLAGWDRVWTSLYSGRLDHLLTEEEASALQSECILRLKLEESQEGQTLRHRIQWSPEGEYRVHEDGSVLVLTNGDSEVWASARDFAVERIPLHTPAEWDQILLKKLNLVED